MDYQFRFPKDLYSEVRIEEYYRIWLAIQNGKVENDGESAEVGAMVRVFDGNMWYTATTNSLEEIQSQLDALAAIAAPNPNIYEHPIVKEFEVNRDAIMTFDTEQDIRKVPRNQLKEILDGYVEKCIDPEDKDVTFWVTSIGGEHEKRRLITSKGTDVAWDTQCCSFSMFYGFTVDGVTSYGGYNTVKMTMPELLGLEEKVLNKKAQYLNYAKNAKDIEPGDYECVLAPVVTAMFTHESFGHKSEADFMLTDKTLAEEWVLGKKVGSEKITICDDGSLVHHGYVPYDDEGTKACKTYLMKEGVLTGRLHDAKSASTMGEQKTGNARAQDYHKQPIVRMTNTYMEAGTDKLEDMIAGIKDGVYVMDVSNGTGNSTFVMNPTLCFRIRDGKVCEPIRVHMLTGSVFQTLFDVDAVGDDFELFDSYNCGKGGQMVRVSAGGPSIRVKKLSIS
ncbi:MAG: TldD/PmbA family protein [Lachnospiraceae bacterium]|nr:TldD/PmbA family protein [Lachnospiraceae bacterium]MBQ2101002.1 TldD/PmbA family protein [Lachnospiraceae bacterium]